MSVSDDRWTCPDCRRTTVVTGTVPDTRVALAAVRDHHQCGHEAAAKAEAGTVTARRLARRRAP